MQTELDLVKYMSKEQKPKQPKTYKEIIQEKSTQRLQKARSYENAYEAIQEYQQVLFLDQANYVALRELSQLYVQIGDLSAAIVCLQQSLQIQSATDVEEKLRLLIQQRGQNLLEQGDWNNFLEGTEFERFGLFLQYYRKDLQNLKANQEIDRQAVKAFQRAHCFALCNHLVYALQETETALRLNQTVVEFFLLRGKLLWALNKEPQGNYDYWKAHSLSPNHLEVQEFLGHVMPKTQAIIAETKFLVVQNQTEKCHLNIKRGLDMYPNNPDLLLIKSYLHRSNGEYEQALIDLDQCLRNSKENQEQIHHQIALTYNEMAMFLFQKAKYEDALTLFNEALKYKTTDWGILVNRGDAHKELGKSTEALADYQEALKLSTKPEIIQRVVQMLVQRGVEYFNRRQYDVSLSYFEQGLKLVPQEPTILFKRGKCLFELQRYGEALQDFNEVARLDPSNFEAQQLVMQMKSSQRGGNAVIYLNDDDK